MLAGHKPPAGCDKQILYIFADHVIDDQNLFHPMQSVSNCHPKWFGRKTTF